MATAVKPNLSESMRGVLRTPPAERTSTGQLVERLLTDHKYAGGIRPVAWPARQRELPMPEWVELLSRLYVPDQRLHGRHAILGVALLDPICGRRIVECGLAHAIAAELLGGVYARRDGVSPPWLESLSDRGRERLASIPLLAADAGIEGPVVGLQEAHGPPKFAPEGDRLAVGQESRAPAVYDDRLRRLATVEGEPSAMIAWSADGEHLYLVAGQTLVRAPVPPGDGQPVRVRAEDELRDVLVDPRGEWVVTVSASGAVERWPSGLDGEPERIANDQVLAAMEASGNSLVCADAAGALTVWDARTGESPTRLRWNPRPLKTVIASGGGTILAQSSQGEVIFFQGESDTVLAVARPAIGIGWLPATGEIISVTPERLEVAGLDGSHRVLDGAMPMAVAPGDQRLATAGPDGGVRIWNPLDGARLAELRMERMPVGLTFSPDGSRLAVVTESELRVVDVGLIRRQPHVLAEYAADTVSPEADLLGIDDDVDAFAALAAARSVVPPLSIALFGEWGAGKSFFMRRMRRAVDELSRESRDSGAPQHELAFHKRIAQVEFNAWHYAEGNLWASLVDHLLANLRIDPEESTDRVERRKRKVLNEIAATRADAQAAERAKQEAEHLREKAERSLEEARVRERDLERQLQEAMAVAPEAKVELSSGDMAAARKALDMMGMKALGDAAADLADALGQARDRLERQGASSAPTRAPDAEARWRKLIALLAGGPLLGLVVGTVLVLLFPDAIGLLAGAATGIAVVLNRGAGWVREQLEWRDAQLAEVDAARLAVLQPLEAARRDQAETVTELERNLGEAQRAVGHEEDESARKAVDVQRLEEELAAVTPASMFTELVSAAIASEDYSRQLGIVARVRRQFEAMCELLALHNARFEAGAADADEELGIGRIVLYIDDLDRCRPAKVVEVLEAIHLLLAFPLFVVVVGVDARWLTRSLAMRHPHLLAVGDDDGRKDDGATPWDYLEKIFQVPFWLEPLDQDATRRMLKGLLPAAAAVTSTAASAPAPDQSATGTADDGVPGGAAGGAVAGSGGDGNARASAQAPRDLQPESLEMTPYELSIMERLAPLLGRSPRALKRFVNTYRLVKARLGDPIGFSAPRAPLRHDDAVMLLLALNTGFPRLGPRLLDSLLAPPTGPTTLRRHVELLARTKDDANVAREACVVLRWCDDEKAAGSWPSVDGARLRRWADEIARFSFRADAPREGVVVAAL